MQCVRVKRGVFALQITASQNCLRKATLSGFFYTEEGIKKAVSEDRFEVLDFTFNEVVNAVYNLI